MNDTRFVQNAPPEQSRAEQSGRTRRAERSGDCVESSVKKSFRLPISEFVNEARAQRVRRRAKICNKGKRKRNLRMFDNTFQQSDPLAPFDRFSRRPSSIGSERVYVCCTMASGILTIYEQHFYLFVGPVGSKSVTPLPRTL